MNSIYCRPIYLIQPPVNLAKTTPCLDDKQFGLGLLALGAYLESKGYNVKGVHVPNRLWNSDCRIEDIVDEIAAERPLLIALGLNWVHFSRGAIELSKLLQNACPQTPIVVGGQHATLFATDIIGHYGDVFDGVVVGEAEKTLHRICEFLAHCDTKEELNKKQLPSIAGLLRAGNLAEDRRLIYPEVIEDINRLPYYSYSLLEKRAGEPDVAAVSTCRGACPYQCAFCVEHVIGSLQGRQNLIFHSAEWIAGHIEHLMDQGIRRITIQDSFFIGGDKLITDVADHLQKKNLHLDHINIFAHPNSYGSDGFNALASMAKLASLDFGIETGSKLVSKKIGRPLKPDRVVKQLSDAVDTGVFPYTWWLTGLPDGKDAMADTEDLLIKTMRVGAIPRWVSPLVLLPRTPMHDQPEKYNLMPRFNSFDDYRLFSEVSLFEALFFDDLITHKTQARSYGGIREETLSLRRFICEHFTVVEEFWKKRDSTLIPPDLFTTKERIQASFF